MNQVSITRGQYRGREVSGVFNLVKGFVDKGNGYGFITIHNPNHEAGHPAEQRVKLSVGDFALMASDSLVTGTELVPVNNQVPVVINYEREFAANETEEQAMERIADTFLMLDKITDACARGVIRGLVVSGPPGIGKSYGVERQLDAVNMFRKIAGQEPKYTIVSGGVSPIGLYQKLYHNRHNEQVLVFDDCDGVLFEEDSLNLLKAALNSGDRRRICWNKESRVLQSDDIPDTFDFEGSIIFLSNIDFERTIARGSRISSHLAAIMSRCHYLDLEIGSTRDKLLRIRQIIRDGMLEPYEFSEEQQMAVVSFVMDNHEHLRELSLRMVKKVADFVRADPDNWYEMAECTCLTKEAKFKRLLEKKNQEAERRGVVMAEQV